MADRIVKFKVVQDEIPVCVAAAKAYISNPPENLDKVIGTEEHLAIKWNEDKKEFEECDWADPECYARGKIDILMMDGDVATVIDHKTQLYMESADTFQMGFYAWLVTKFYPYIKEVNTILHYCHPNLNAYSRPYTWTKADIEEHESVIKIRIFAAENMEDFSPSANAHCQYCPLVLECPLIDELNKSRIKYGKLSKSHIVTAREAQELAEILTVVDEGRKVLNQRLQQFTGQIGPVIIPGRQYGYNVTEGWEVDRKKIEPIFTLFKESGLDPFEILDIDTNRLKKIWKTVTPQFIEKVKAHLTRTKKTRFGPRKV